MITGLVLCYLFLPLAATFLYSVATEWHNSILPEGLTAGWYVSLFHDPRFLDALLRTVLVSAFTVALSILVMVPAIFVITFYFPYLERWLQGLATLPYSIPGVILAVGLIKVYSGGPVPLTGTFWILAGAYFVVILPYMYQGVKNSMRTVDAIKLMDAAELLGAGRGYAFRAVILPNILPGIMVSTLLSFSVLFGEFALANLLAGGQYETIQVYLMLKLDESGHLSSALVMSYFVAVLVLSWLTLRLGQRLKGKPGREIKGGFKQL